MSTAVNETSQYEIERGKPMPSKAHSIVQVNIGTELNIHYRKQFRIMSELSLELEGWKSVPDLVIYPYFEMDFRHDEIRMTEPPLCAIEILSATQGILEISDKANQYFANGVKSCWIVIPQFKTVYVFSSADDYETYTGKDTLRDSVLDMELELEEVFR
jgi:Uma2 family endonuclease